MKPLIIYHGPGCMDGAASALAAWLKFGDEAEYRLAQYGDSAPTDEEVRGREVYILDFSYPRAELVRMYTVNAHYYHDGCGVPRKGSIVVLDHHRTAAADLADLSFCTFNMAKSGAVLAWEHFHVRDANRPDHRATYILPELFAYIQDRDLWQWALPHSREVSAALAASGALTDFRKLIPFYQEWDNGSDSDYASRENLIRGGAAILRVEQQMIERIVATAEEVELSHTTRVEKPDMICDTCGGDGEVHSHNPKCWTCKGSGKVDHKFKIRSFRALASTSAVLQSEIGEALALESARRGRDAVGVVYYRDGAADKWRVSLRSRDTVEQDDRANALVPAPDVSTIAKSFGGGGHKQAAGFECNVLPWDSK